MSALILSGDPRACDETRRWYVNGAPAAAPTVRWHVHVGDDWETDAPDEGTGFAGERHGLVFVGQHDGGIRLRHPAGLLIDVAARNAAVSWRMRPDAALDFGGALQTVGMLTLIFALRRVGWHHLHAATLESPEGHGWLLLGGSGAGKSTSAALLGRAGWRVGGDDAVFLVQEESSIAAYPWRAPFGLRPDVTAMFEVAPEAHHDDLKARPPFSSLGVTPVTMITPSTLALLNVVEGESTRSSVRQVEAMSALLAQGAWVVMEPQFADEYLTLLTRLLHQASAVRVRIGRELGADAPRLFYPVRT